MYQTTEYQETGRIEPSITMYMNSNIAVIFTLIICTIIIGSILFTINVNIKEIKNERKP